MPRVRSSVSAHPVLREFGLGSNGVPAMLLPVKRAIGGNWPQKPLSEILEILMSAKPVDVLLIAAAPAVWGSTAPQYIVEHARGRCVEMSDNVLAACL